MLFTESCMEASHPTLLKTELKLFPGYRGTRMPKVIQYLPKVIQYLTPEPSVELAWDSLSVPSP